jgi:cbb3-type cytochrome oxidase subunit 1
MWTLYRMSHIHMLLLGFVTMMIYGVGYHVVLRFTGSPLHRARAARAYIFVYLLWRTLDAKRPAAAGPAIPLRRNTGA